jgi:hypothetical protein
MKNKEINIWIAFAGPILCGLTAFLCLLQNFGFATQPLLYVTVLLSYCYLLILIYAARGTIGALLERIVWCLIPCVIKEEEGEEESPYLVGSLGPNTLKTPLENDRRMFFVENWIRHLKGK